MPGKVHPSNGIGHFDISGPDIEVLRTFYAGVFDWGVTPRGPGYAMVGTPEGGPDGALVEAEGASLTVGVVVPDLNGRWNSPSSRAARSPCRCSTMAGSRKPRSATRRAIS